MSRASGDVQLRGAAALDAAGRHAEAAAVLTEAALNGHVGAMTLLAARKLTGRGAPFAPAEGVRLVLEAAGRGGPEACTIAAVLNAMGSGVPQSWPQALEWLGRASGAYLGSATAQLRLLAAGPQGRAVASGLRGAALASAVDMAAWLAPAPKRPLCEAPRIRALDGFAPAAVCDWLVAKARGRAAPAQVYDEATGAARVEDARTNSAFEMSLVDLDVVTVMLRARIGAATGLPPAAMEPPQVLHYAVGQRFGAHFDFLDTSAHGMAGDVASRGQRIVTFLLYLNDDYEGGQTDFPRAGVSHRGRRGDALMFANLDAQGAPERLSLHAGLAPTRGEKWLFSQWIRDRTPPV